MKCRLIAKTIGLPGTEYEGRTIDEIIVSIARLSSSKEANERFADPAKLLRHCIRNGHWSIFELANLVFEVETSRASGRDLIRHRMGKQEFSQRYARVPGLEPIELRKQATQNRQSSTEPLNNQEAEEAVNDVLAHIMQTYDYLLSVGTARETARFILPGTASTTIIFNGQIRDFITMLNQRLHKTAQKECQDIAKVIRDEFINQCPIISEALFNFENAYEVHILDRVVLEKYGVYNHG
jgi:thymidylate synthase (FAD)